MTTTGLRTTGLGPDRDDLSLLNCSHLVCSSGKPRPQRLLWPWSRHWLMLFNGLPDPTSWCPMSAPARRGFSLHIFLPDGTPEGLRLVEKSNWTGHGIVCPRSRFKDAKSRPEFDRTGVYVLVGPSEDSDLPTVYIGEGDSALDRLERHFAEKDFWTSLVLFTSKDDNLNKAHVQYLESRLCTLAREANRSVLDNVTDPQLPSLSEADVAEVEGFLDEMLLIFPLLGLTAFEKPQPA